MLVNISWTLYRLETQVGLYSYAVFKRPGDTNRPHKFLEVVLVFLPKTIRKPFFGPDSVLFLGLLMSSPLQGF